MCAFKCGMGAARTAACAAAFTHAEWPLTNTPTTPCTNAPHTARQGTRGQKVQRRRRQLKQTETAAGAPLCAAANEKGNAHTTSQTRLAPNRTGGARLHHKGRHMCGASLAGSLLFYGILSPLRIECLARAKANISLNSESTVHQPRQSSPAATSTTKDCTCLKAGHSSLHMPQRRMGMPSLL